MSELTFSSVDVLSGVFKHPERAEYVKSLLGQQFYTFSRNTLKSAIDGQRHTKLADENEFQLLVKMLAAKDPVMTKLGRNNMLTKEIRKLKYPGSQEDGGKRDGSAKPKCVNGPGAAKRKVHSADKEASGIRTRRSKAVGSGAVRSGKPGKGSKRRHVRKSNIAGDGRQTTEKDIGGGKGGERASCPFCVHCQEVRAAWKPVNLWKGG